MEKRLVASLDEREGAVFSGIDAVAGKVAPGADALVAIARRDRSPARRPSPASSKMTPLLESVDAAAQGDEPALSTGVSGGSASSFSSLSCCCPGWPASPCSRSTGVWPPDADSDTWWRMHLYERYGQDLKGCVLDARAKGQNMMCPIFDMNP